jgi:hypothetical protein
MQQAAHTTILLSLAQLLSAISWPRIFRRGKVITNFAGLKMFVYKFKFFAPLIIELIKKSFSKLHGQLLSLCASFRSDKYTETEFGLMLQSFKAQAT